MLIEKFNKLTIVIFTFKIFRLKSTPLVFLVLSLDLPAGVGPAVEGGPAGVAVLKIF